MNLLKYMTYTPQLHKYLFLLDIFYADGGTDLVTSTRKSIITRVLRGMYLVSGYTTDIGRPGTRCCFSTSTSVPDARSLRNSHQFDCAMPSPSSVASRNASPARATRLPFTGSSTMRPFSRKRHIA